MTSGWYEDGDLVVDFRGCRVWLKGREIHISALRFRILGYLIENAGRPITSREILRHAWEDVRYDVGLVRWHIARLRQELGDLPPKRIVHVRGYGYRYDPAALRQHTSSGRQKINGRLREGNTAPKCFSNSHVASVVQPPARNARCYQYSLRHHH